MSASSTRTCSSTVSLDIAPTGKKAIAASMYNKGKAFVGAAILLSQQSDSEHVDYVVLHLLCQGIEIALKGLLLLSNYDRYHSRLKRSLGHNLHKIVLEAVSAYSTNPLRPDLDQELRALSNLYSQHLLRYGSTLDVFIDPRSVARTKVFRRIAAVIRLAEPGFSHQNRP